MNFFLLSLIARSIERAMMRFSQLPVKTLVLTSSHIELLSKLTRTILETYIRFVHNVNIAPREFQYTPATIVKKLEVLGIDDKYPESLDNKLLSLIKFPVTTPVVPVDLQLSKAGFILLYSGIGVFENMNETIVFFIHELSIRDDLIRYTPSYLRYLDDILITDNVSKFKSVRDLAASFDKNYNRFQNDCKEYFNDTFHQFHNKIKMLNALEDIMMSDSSLKEVAYKNNFTDYNSMYFLFHTRYNFPLQTIPRISGSI